MITMKLARREFAARVTTRAAVYETRQELYFNAETKEAEPRPVKVKTAPRKRVRKPQGASFRVWARAKFASVPRAELCTKLRAILDRDPSKR